jgi:hypothetical protein
MENDMDLTGHATPPTVDAIFEWYLRQRKDAHRPHLGGSQIGRACQRALWYQFRHMDRATFDGRVLRLFETGDREEGRIVANLRAVGVTVWDVDPDTGRQIRFTAHDGHFALSLDGVGKGFRESGQPHTLEFKTMNDKNFRAMERDGLEKAKPIYWAQCQIGMHLADLDRCAFIAVNKNTDAIYMERVRRDPAEGMKLLAKAGEIIWADKPPAKLSNDPSFFECKFCDYRNICHLQKPPEVNCRTCAHATPERGGDGDWSCAKGRTFGKVCDAHLFNPHAMPWEVYDATPDWVEYQTGDGEIVRNEGNSQAIADEWVPF